MDWFTRFLVRRNLYNVFLDNIKHYSACYNAYRNRFKTPLDMYNSIKGNKQPCLSAFDWIKTPEGVSFWNDINKEYMDFLYMKEKQDNI